MSSLETDLRAWVAQDRELRVENSADSVYGVALAVMAAFFESHPEHKIDDLPGQDAMLSVMATDRGFDHPVRWLGQAICQGNGDQLFRPNVRPKPTS